MSGHVQQFEANGGGALTPPRPSDKWSAVESRLLGRAQRAEEQLARALERERLLQQKLDAHARSDESLQKRLDLNLTVLDQKVADMRETLNERDRAILRSERIVAQLEQQNRSLKQQLEIANQKLDEHAELERQHRLKMKEALDKVKNADKDKAALQAALGQSAHEERQALLAELQQAQAGLRDQLELEQTHHAEEKKRLEEELQAVKDTAAFSDADLLQSELSKLRHELDEKAAVEALLRRDGARQQQQLKKYEEEVKDLKRQVDEAGNLWKKAVAELSAAKEYMPRCELLEQEVQTLKAQVHTAGCRVEELERSCSSMVDLLLTVKDHVSAAGACAQDTAQFLKAEMSTFFDEGGDAGTRSPSCTADAGHGEKMMATFEQLQGALQLMLESPTVGEVLKSISSGPGQLVGIGETAKQLGKQLHENHRAVHQRLFKMFEMISTIVRALDQASYELQGTKPLDHHTSTIGPMVSTTPLIAPTASAATHVSVVSTNDASTAQATAAAAAAAATAAAASANIAESGDAQVIQRTLQQVAESLSMLAAATSRTPSYAPNPVPGPDHAREGGGRADMKMWQGRVASPPEASPPIIEWGLEGAPSPVLSSTSESVGGGFGRESMPGSAERGRGKVGKEGVKRVFKALMELEEDGVEEKGAGERGKSWEGERRAPGAVGSGKEGGGEGEMVTVRKALIQTYREQMMELERGLSMMQEQYMRKELHEKELGACEEMWAGKLDRYRQASELHVMGLQSQVDLLSSRGMALEAENQTLQDRAVASEYKTKGLQAKVQYLEESGRQDHESVAQINMEAHMRISSLAEELAAAQLELERRGDYDAVVEERENLKDVIAGTRENLKDVIAETAASVGGAMEQQLLLVTSNEELEAKIVSLQKEMRLAHKERLETEQDCKLQVETAFEKVEKTLLRNTELEADLKDCRKCLQDSLALNDVMKENIEAEKLKTLSAEIHNIQQVQIPQEELEDAKEQAQVLMEKVRLLEEQLEEEKKQHAKRQDESQLLASQFKLESEKSSNSKQQVVQLMEEVQEVKEFFATAFAAVLQDSLILITDNRKRDMLIKTEREEREAERAKDRIQLLKEQEALKEKHEKLMLQSQEINDMAVQYKQLLSKADEELNLSGISVSKDPSQTSSGDADANGESAAKVSTPSLLRAARATPPTGKPPLSPPAPSSAGDGGRFQRASPAGVDAATAAAGQGVPAKVFDALMNQTMKVANTPEVKQDSSDDEDNILEEGKQKVAAATAAVLAAAGGGGEGLQVHWLTSAGVEVAGGDEEDAKKAHAQSGDSALNLAREKLAAGDITAANAASAAAAKFYDAAGEYGDDRALELAELDTKILALAQGTVERAGLMQGTLAQANLKSTLEVGAEQEGVVASVAEGQETAGQASSPVGSHSSKQGHFLYF